MKSYHRIVPLGICSLLIVSIVEVGCATSSASESPQRQAASQPAAAQGTPQVQPASGELDGLVAPISLYPDALVAQILAASTYPTEVVEAERWMQQHAGLAGPALAQAVDQQSWDPSVKALTQFPTVLAMMDTNLSWTSALGEAYVSDAPSVLAAVQALRHRAQQAGNLQSNSQELVTDAGQTITIEPASAQVVYVPEYDPWLVYGAPIAFYPGWVNTPGVFFDAPGVYFDVGVGIGLFGGFAWGWHHWDADWHRHSVWFDHHPYVSRSPTFHQPDHGHGAFDHGPRGFDHSGGGPGGVNRVEAGRGAFGVARPGPSGSNFAMRGMHSGAFGGFNHGGVVAAYSARGQASFGGSMHPGGFHAGGFGGGFHGGGGHH